MKKVVLFAPLLVAISLSAQSMTPPLPSVEESASSWVLTNSVVSQYMFRGVRLGGASFQPAIEFDRGSLGLGIWANTPLKDKVPGQSDPEFDFYGFYALEVAKDFSVVPGFTVYACPNAEKSNGFYKITCEPNLALNYSLGGIKITPKVYYDFITKGPTAELTAAFAVPLTSLGTELDFTGSIGTYLAKDYTADADPKVKNWGDYYLLGVTAPFQVSKDAKLAIGWAYTAGSNNYVKQGTDRKVPNSAALGRGVLTISYIVSF